MVRARAAGASAEDGIGRIAELETELERKRTRASRFVNRQTTSAAFGLGTLDVRDLRNLFDSAVCPTAGTVEVELVTILGLQPGSDELVVRTRAGGREDLVGLTTVPVGVH